MKKLIGFFLGFSLPVFANVIPTEPHIYVEGYAEQLVYPDQVKTIVEIAELNMDPELAKQKVEQKAEGLLLALQPVGIAKEHIRTLPLSMHQEYDYENSVRVFKGSRVELTLDLTLPEPAKYPQFLDVLIKSGISNIISNVGVMKDERAVKKQVAMLALKDARQKAEDMAASQGKKIKDVYSISEFKTRPEEQFLLKPAQAIGNDPLQGNTISFDAPPPPPAFEISAMKASAIVYVVYTLK